MKGKRKVFGWLSCLAVFLSALWPCACSYAARESDFSLILAVDEAQISVGEVTARATFRNLTAQTMKIVGTREAGEEMIIHLLPARRRGSGRGGRFRGRGKLFVRKGGIYERTHLFGAGTGRIRGVRFRFVLAGRALSAFYDRTGRRGGAVTAASEGRGNLRLLCRESERAKSFRFFCAKKIDKPTKKMR